MIKTVIRSNDNMVIVFDENGELLPHYQGRYEEVRQKIMDDSPPEARFVCFPDNEVELKLVTREEW